jgi:hypothetical protein
MKICTTCQRYVQNDETTCPFCSSTELRAERMVSGAGRGLSRAKIFAARAVIAGSTLGTVVACGDDESEDDSATATGGTNMSGGASTMSSGGANASTGGAQNPSSGGSIDQGGAGPESSGGDSNYEVGVPIYGGPFPDMMKARV